MPNLNQVMLIGHLGNDPKITDSKTKVGLKIANFSLATTERVFQKKDGSKVEEQTEWHNIVLFGKLAEVAEKYLRKGNAVFIQGRLKTRSYEKDGIKRYMTEIIGDMMQMLTKGEKVEENEEKPLKKGVSVASLMDDNRNDSINNDDVPF